MNKQQTADAFVAGKPGRCHTSHTDGKEYVLYQSTVAKHGGCGFMGVTLDFCGRHTATTASHLNAILKALGASFRVSYAAARDGDQPSHYEI